MIQVRRLHFGAGLLEHAWLTTHAHRCREHVIEDNSYKKIHCTHDMRFGVGENEWK